MGAAALPIHLASLPIAFAILLYIDRGLWFFYDEWEFLAVRGTAGQALNLFTPHNEHWSTVPILIYRALYAAAGLNTYIPYLVVLLVVHVALAHVLFRIMRRLEIDAWIATAAATVFLFLGAGAEDLTWAFQMAWILSLLLGLIGLLVVDHDRPGLGRDAAYWAIAVLALMCSGVTVPLVAVAGLVALTKRGWRAALRVVSVPTLVYLVWFAAIGHVGYTTHPTRAEVLQVPQYVWTGLTTAISNTLGWAGSGAIVLLGLALFLALQGPNRWRSHANAVAMALGSVLFFAITGVGRIALGVSESTDSRYSYVAAALLLPAGAWAVGALARRIHGGRTMVVILSAVVAINGVGVLTAYSEGAAGLRDTDRFQVLAAAHLITSGAPLLGGDQAKPDPLVAPQLTVGELRALIGDHAIPLGTPVPPDAVLRAALQLQVALESTIPAFPGGSPSISANQGVALHTVGTCASVTAYSTSAQLSIDFPVGGWISLRSGQSGTLSISLASTAGSTPVTSPRSFPVVSGHRVYLQVAANGVIALVSLPLGVSIVCGTT